MATTKGRGAKVEALVTDLANEDPVARQCARELLVALGSDESRQLWLRN